MNTATLFDTQALWGLPLPSLMAEESAALIILAASLLVFRTFRERYLLVWIGGWVAYVAAQWGLHHPVAAGLSYVPAIFQATFVLAIGLFAASIFLYSHARRFLLPLLLITLAVAGYAIARVLVWPSSLTLRVALEVSYRLILVWAAFQLLLFRWGRGEIGPWFLALSLMTLHLDWAPLTGRLPFAFDMMADMLLGLSMLLVVFDDSRTRTRRLGVINALTSSISRAQQHEPMMATALEELKKLMNARAAWFRVLEGEKLVMTQQIGLSSEFAEFRNAVPLDDKFESTLSSTAPVLVKTAAADDSVRPYLKRERFNHIIMIPVHGRKAPIGTLALGSRRRLSYAPDELEFLTTTAQQVGMAFENMKLVEQILRSHRQWANTFDSIQDVVLVHDAEYRVMRANRALLERLARSAADIAGETCLKVLPHTGEWESCPYCPAAEDGFNEGRDLCFGGTSMVSTSSYVDQNTKQKGTIHVVRDVTERSLAEEKYKLLFEQMQEGVFATTPDGKLLDCNDALVRMLGYNGRNELMGLNVDSEMYSSPERREAFRREVEEHNYVRNFEVTLRRKDGSLLAALESSFATRGADGKIERYQGFLLDITEKKRAEDEIRRRNRELNALNAMAVIATQSFDLDEIMSLTLRQVLSLLGADSGAVFLADAESDTFRRRAGWGQRSSERTKASEIQFHEGFGDLVTRSRTEVLTAEYLPHLPKSVADFIKSDGQSAWIWVLLWSKDRPVGIMGIGSSDDNREYSSNDENLLVAVGRQLATTIEKVRLYEETCRAYEDLRLTQEKLLQSEKMSAVGQLIAGVAHELNNPLTAILGYAQLLESEELNERQADYVSKLFKQAQRTHRVVQNLLSFARQRKPQKQDVDVRKVLEETLTLRDYDLRVNNVRIVRQMEDSIPAVTADPHQLEQVFLNIINNAVDAILEKGDGGTLKVRVYSDDGLVHMVFQDSGPGIKEPGRIFDPFYTTKSVGKGTGLGLSICYGIIKEHGGDIIARNRTEGGAIIEVSLPSAGQSALPEKQSVATKRELVIEGRILLVEDEEAILELEKDVLTGAGADVVTLSDSEAVKARLQKEPFDAIIMSGKMAGGWNITEAYEWLKEKCPGLERHVMVTFATEPQPEVRVFLVEHNVPFLVKPFEFGDVITQARRLLHKTQAASAD